MLRGTSSQESPAALLAEGLGTGSAGGRQGESALPGRGAGEWHARVPLRAPVSGFERPKPCNSRRTRARALCFPHAGSPMSVCLSRWRLPGGGRPLGPRVSTSTRVLSSSPSGRGTAGILESGRAGPALASLGQTGVNVGPLGVLPLGVTCHPSCFPLVFLIPSFFHIFMATREQQPPRFDGGRDPSLLRRSGSAG